MSISHYDWFLPYLALITQLQYSIADHRPSPKLNLHLKKEPSSHGSAIMENSSKQAFNRSMLKNQNFPTSSSVAILSFFSTSSNRYFESSKISLSLSSRTWHKLWTRNQLDGTVNSWKAKASIC